MHDGLLKFLKQVGSSHSEPQTKICHKVAFDNIYNKQRLFQLPVIDLNMELLVKFVNDFKQ